MSFDLNQCSITLPARRRNLPQIAALRSFRRGADASLPRGGAFPLSVRLRPAFPIVWANRTVLTVRPGLWREIHAREGYGLDHEADEIKLLADSCRIGEKVTVEDGFDDQGNPWQKTITGTADMVERAKLQIDARKWRLSKLPSKRYGDRLEVQAAAAGPAIQLNVMLAGMEPETGELPSPIDINPPRLTVGHADEDERPSEPPRPAQEQTEPKLLPKINLSYC
jgi:hypothetical protein